MPSSRVGLQPGDLAAPGGLGWLERRDRLGRDPAVGAECVTVTDGKITYSRFIFDRAPFDAARQTAT